MINDVTKQGVRIHAHKVRTLTICIVNGCAGVGAWFTRLNSWDGDGKSGVFANGHLSSYIKYVTLIK